MTAPVHALAFLDMLGGPEIMLVMVVALIFFGGEKMPGFARGLGKAIRELKKAASDVENEFKRAMDESERPRPPVPAALPATVPRPEVQPLQPISVPPVAASGDAPPASPPPPPAPAPAPDELEHPEE
jgi:sec-independent protein translocase protein TatA